MRDTVSTRFPDAAREPVVVVADTVADSPTLAGYLTTVRALPGVEALTTRPVSAAVTVVEVRAAGDTQGHTATDVVTRLRGLSPPFATAVTGPAAKLVDTRESLAERLPWALGLIVVSTFVLLFAFTGSLVVPVKAVVMNTLSLGVSSAP